MRVRVRLFASLRESMGQGEVWLDLPAGATPEDAWGRLCEAHPPLRERRRSLSAAVNRRYAPFEAVLEDGDELVFIPPVAGG
jgi:sulfur-carrier protein